VRLALPLLAALTIALGACDDDSAGDSEQFCAEVAENVEALRAAPATDDDVDNLIDLWRKVGDDAPLAIEAEWTRLVDNLELAWTSDDQHDILASTFASERSAVDVATWIADNCGFDFGPVTTIVPGTVAITTLPGAITTSRSSTTTSP
jgi:hypothetical protein